MTGTVIRLLPNKGFCFVRGSDGLTRFLHATQLQPNSAFDTLREGQGVEFEPVEVPDGKGNKLRAINAKLLE